EVDFLARDAGTLHVADANADVADVEPLRQRLEPVGIQTHGDQRPKRHVARDAAERMQDCDRHQLRYETPLPVLNTATRAVFSMRPWSTILRVTASAQPPSGAASMPVSVDIHLVPARIASSETESASPL